MLTHIHLTSFSTDISTWTILSGLPHLISLHATAPNKSEVEKQFVEVVPCLPVMETPFPSIKVLEISDLEGSRAFEMLSAFFKPKLRHLEVLKLMYPDPDNNTTTGDILQCIAGICYPSKLHTLSLYVENHDEGPPDVLPHTLMPLYPFHNLRSIEISPMTCNDLDNKTIEAMALAWPRMEELDIGWEQLWVEDPRVTLEGLIPFARCCPYLKSLNIVVNALRPIPDDVTRIVLENQWGSSLDHLCLTSSPIGKKRQEYKNVAAFLIALFPRVSCLGGVDGSLDPDDEYMQTWREVDELIGEHITRTLSTDGEEDEKKFSDDD